ncbi:MAG: sulfotransferase [Nocardioides sp.]
MSGSGEPLLVTGVPRSGTTWLARLLSMAPGTALAGREPMNPRGRQYALSGTLGGWTRLELPTSRQRRALRATYRGINPRTFGRYGRSQWRAPWPGTRVVVKDPFAMLSVPCIAAVTGARAIQLYRHPGAVLASYRRMGWHADVAELRPFGEAADRAGALVGELWAQDPAELNDTDAMGVFWSVLTTIALDGLAQTSGAIMVAHREVAAGGLVASARLFDELGLEFSDDARAELDRIGTANTDQQSLHRFDRNPADVADAWKKHLSAADLTRIELITQPVRDRVEGARLRLLTMP